MRHECTILAELRTRNIKGVGFVVAELELDQAVWVIERIDEVVEVYFAVGVETSLVSYDTLHRLLHEHNLLPHKLALVFSYVCCGCQRRAQIRDGGVGSPPNAF